MVVGLATLGVAAYVGGRLFAQQQPVGGAVRPASATRGTRVAILNLKYVVTNYKKWTAFQDEYKAQYKVYEEKVQAKNKTLEAYKQALAKPELDAATREKYEKDGKTLQREMQDIADEAKNTLGKKESDQLVIIYKEVAQAVSQFATANDLDLVLHYNDATTPEEMSSAANIHRKMGSGPCTPVYYKPGEVDISLAILQMLNQKLQASAPAAAPGNNTTANSKN
jgi:Skp family chaperone for outer membrane proteins